MSMELEKRICPAGLGRRTISKANLPPEELQAEVIKKMLWGDTGWCESSPKESGQE
jgi:hypothetical protein